MPVLTKNLSIFSFSMKNFLLNVVAFAFIVLLINEITSYFINPFNGAAGIEKKVEFIQKDTTKYDAILFGSSRLFRAFNPRIFDSVLASNNFKSYNLAAPGVNCPEVFYLLDNYIRLASTKPDYVFIELISFDIIKKKWDDVPKYFYWERLPYYGFCLQYLLNSHDPVNLKSKLLWLHTKGWLYKNSRFPQFNSFFDPPSAKKYFGEDEQGYLAVEDVRGIGDKQIEFRKERFAKIRQALDTRRETLIYEYSSEYDSTWLNQYYLEYLVDLIEEYNSHGIHLVYIIPPRADTFLQEIALLHKLPAENIIDMGNPIKYPEFYSFEYTFDKSHLNKSGARLFSIKFARKFKRQIINENQDETQ